MCKASVDQCSEPRQDELKTYLREYQAEEAKATRQQDPRYVNDFRRLRARRDQLIAQLANAAGGH